MPSDGLLGRFLCVQYQHSVSAVTVGLSRLGLVLDYLGFFLFSWERKGRRGGWAVELRALCDSVYVPPPLVTKAKVCVCFDKGCLWARAQDFMEMSDALQSVVGQAVMQCGTLCHKTLQVRTGAAVNMMTPIMCI